MKLTYIKLFVDYLDAVEVLGDAERGRLFTALLQYARTGATPDLPGNERILFPMMRAQIDRDIQDLEELSEIRSESGKKGGRPRKQEEAKKPNAFSKSKKSKDKDKDKDNNPPYNPPAKTHADLINAYTFDQDLRDALTAFVEMRKTAKRPATDRALKAIFAKLDKFAAGVVDKIGYQIACVDKSTTNCWTDVYQLKPDEFVDKPQPPTVIEPMKPDDRRVIDENTTIDDLF